MQQESGGHQYMNGHLTRSVHGAVGLMQIKPDTYAELAQRYNLGSDPYNPHDNIMAASGYIRELYDRFGSPDFLGAYNCGPQCMDNHRSRGTPLPGYARTYMAAITPHLNDPVPASTLPAQQPYPTPVQTIPADAPIQLAQTTPQTTPANGQASAPPLADDTLPPPYAGADGPAPALDAPTQGDSGTTDVQSAGYQPATYRSVSTTALLDPALSGAQRVLRAVPSYRSGLFLLLRGPCTPLPLRGTPPQLSATRSIGWKRSRPPGGPRSGAHDWPGFLPGRPTAYAQPCASRDYPALPLRPEMLHGVHVYFLLKYYSYTNKSLQAPT